LFLKGVAVVVHPYKATNEEELTLLRGEKVYIFSKVKFLIRNVINFSRSILSSRTRLLWVTLAGGSVGSINEPAYFPSIMLLKGTLSVCCHLQCSSFIDSLALDADLEQHSSLAGPISPRTSHNAIDKLPQSPETAIKNMALVAHTETSGDTKSATSSLATTVAASATPSPHESLLKEIRFSELNIIRKIGRGP
jgi:hypothetical protein